MNYQEFLNNIQLHISNVLGSEASVLIQPIRKNNGTQFEGLVIVRPDCNISPTIYLNPYYHRMLDGVPMQDICSDILKTYQDRIPNGNFDTSFFLNYHKVRSHIVPKLINFERNQPLLEEVPHIRFLDLVIVFQCFVNADENEYASILIYNHHMDKWGVNTQELYKAALHNAPLLMPCQFDNLCDLLFRQSISSSFPDMVSLREDIDDMIPMYVLSNAKRINGATTLIYQNMLKQIADYFCKNLIILPSSIHEVLIIPADKEESSEQLLPYSNMVREVNATQVSDEELLSDHVYLYQRDTDSIHIY